MRKADQIVEIKNNKCKIILIYINMLNYCFLIFLVNAITIIDLLKMF